MKTYVVVADTSPRAEALMTERRIPRTHWRLARHRVDVYGMTTDRILVDKEFGLVTDSYVDRAHQEELLAEVARIEYREQRTCERIGLSPPAPQPTDPAA